MVKYPKVTVVVPTYNAEKTIEILIKSLERLDYPKKRIEAVFVDDESSDKTRELIGEHKWITLIKQKHAGPAAARNKGWKKATGEIVVFTDSDCEVPAEWSKKIADELEKEDIVGGSLKPATTYSLAENFEQNRRDRLYGTRRKYVSELPSCNLAFKKKVLEDIKGFNEVYKRASAEDYDLCSRAVERGYKILYEPRIYVTHYHSQNIRGILRRAYVHGQEIIAYRMAKKSTPTHEFIRSLAKFAAIPYLTVKRYRVLHIPLGLAYEILSFLGNMKASMQYLVGVRK
ncbi:MAG: glycosyltransferase [Candidatus Altiarchaeota archaeon]|nr:glycosyltransferase [Candidatus Altiarchaeota archaeon]